MTISDLEVMDKIVAANDKLSWDGWDVRHLIYDEAAYYRTDGVRVNGKWYREKRYSPNEKGYTIPDRLVKVHA